MAGDQVVVSAERLRDELVDLRKALRSRYREPNRQVTADDLRQRAARCAETWMVDLAPRDDIRRRIASEYLAELNVQFQRILTASEHASLRRRYDSATDAILKRFTLDLIIPLKQARGEADAAPQLPTPAPKLPLQRQTLADTSWESSAFIGHSFAPVDKPVAECVSQCLTAIGVSVQTGERPRADRISDKVKRLIDSQYLFVGVFTRRDKVARKQEWTTTPWVVDEKAYAVGKSKKLILLKEEGVGSIGGIQGDYEFIEFSRDRLEHLAIRLMQLFELEVRGLRT
jgi:hypothetical protein